ncbi:MAG TPA: cytochrome c oxidase subunit II [Dehalococcoidia bacterium]
MPLWLVATIVLLGIPLLTAVIAWLADRPVRPAMAAAINRDSVSKAGVITFLLWAALTVAGVAAVVLVPFYSVVGSDKGEEISGAFTFLTALAMPVAAMVISVLVYSVLRRGSDALPPEDGPAYDGRGPFPRLWLGVTAGLTLLIMIYPGLVTLDDVIEKHKDPDLVVEVEARQWTWLMAYPEQGLKNQIEIVIPVDRKVTFNITSVDVVHSFWVPAFLMKVDAIPGHTTTISLVAVEQGDYSDEPLYRLQCAELCGLSHANMRVPVRVVSEAQFADWVKQQTAAAP